MTLLVNSSPKADPVYIRLPKSGQLCPYTGLTRSYLNSLILPGATQAENPPVASISLAGAGKSRGVRLIEFASLLAYLRGKAQS